MLPMNNKIAPTIDATIIAEAADWLVMLQSGEMAEAQAYAFKCWQNQTPAHAAAWSRAQAMLGTFADVPGSIARSTLQKAGSSTRRRNLQILGMLLVSGPVVWGVSRDLPWQGWSADYATAKGEQKTIHLSDGTSLVLNTSSAVDVIFTATERRVSVLSGEVLVTTGKDTSPSYRPFIVTTSQGSMRALGTRFTVRRLDDVTTRLDVFDGAVQVVLSAQPAMRVVQAGGKLVFTASSMSQTQNADVSAMLWEQGMLLAKAMPLSELVGELARYRQGFLRCDPDVAALTVSGAFPVNDTDASLDLLRKTLPVSIRKITGYWVMIGPV